MLREIAVLLFLVSTLPNSAIGAETVSPTQQVQCYSGTTTSSSSTCSGVSIGNMTAKDCCSGNGNTFTFSNQCLGCLLVGFTVTELNFTPDNASDTAMIVLKFEKAIGSFNLRLNIKSVNFSKDSSSEIDDFVSVYPNTIFTTISAISQQFPLKISSGNSKALEEPLEFFVQASLVFVQGDVGLIISQSTVRITIADLDVLTFWFQTSRGNTFTEGDTGPVVVHKNDIRPSRDVTVIVTTRQLFSIKDLLPNEFIADVTDFIQETKEYTFIKNTQEPSILQLFSVVEDNIVEQGTEVFEVVLTSNESLVNISSEYNVQRLFIEDDDDFQIGFWRSQIVVTEGDEVSITIVQTNDVVGIKRIANLIEEPLIENTPVTADDKGIDYNYTIKAEEVPKMIINDTTNQLIPITFTIGSILSDDILEGREHFTLSIEQSNLLHIGDNSSVTIYIRDATAAGVKLQKPVYYTNESSFLLDVCAEIIPRNNKSLAVDLEGTMTVSTTLMENTAKSGVDYIDDTVTFPFTGQSKTACSPVIIISDTFKEDPQENFTITLNSLSGDTGTYFTNVTVNEDPSHIVILDDDGADVYFKQEIKTTFSEADGDQDIYLRYSGSQPSGNVVVEVYNIDTDMEVGRVTFTPSSGNQLVSFSLSNPDNNIALEPDRILNLGIRKSQSFDIGTPSNMMIMIVDDDVVNVTFVSSSYNYNEDHGAVSDIQVQLSSTIAQSLVVSYGGGPSQQNADVTSGVTVSSSVTFPANSQAQTHIGIDTFNLTDDQTALELNEQYQIMFTGSSITDNVNLGQATTVTIQDDDVVVVDFVSGSYSFSEGASQSSGISLMLSTHIAQNVTVRIVGGPGTNQPSSVVVSGTTVDSIVTFPAGQAPLVLPAFTINDDNIGLETDEKFQLELISSSPSENVILGDPGNITITDNDVATITFTDPEYTFLENAGLTRQVTITLDIEVAQDFTVRVSGDTLPLAQGVVDSGSSVNKLITFTAYSSDQSDLVEMQITNDSVSGEPEQRYTLTLSQQPSDVVVTPYSTTTIIIIDDDNSGVRFEPFVGPLFESAEKYDLTVFLNGEISSFVSVDVLDANGSVFSTVMFQPISGTTTQSKVVTVTFTDDNNALEDTETLTFSLSNPKGVNVTSPSTIDVLVTDDDVVTVAFSSLTNNFSENELNPEIGVEIDKTILKDLEVSVFGESLPTSGVEISGQLVNESVKFQARGVMQKTFFIGITNDVIAGENDENYKLKFVKSSPSEGVILGPDATVTIIDEEEPTRTCQYSSTTQDISTFGGSNTYQYNRICEHALLKQMTTIGELGVFIDSFGGTFMTTRVGVRIGLYESIVVGAYNRTVIRENSTSQITFTKSSTKLSITVSSLGLTVEITDSRISVIVASDSELQEHMGLCGDLNGEFKNRNMTDIDLTDMTSLDRMISRFLTLPSETFIRKMIRPECGLLIGSVREDLGTEDLFVVPLYTPSAAENHPHNYSLCYQIHGLGNETYNFISDECTQVSAHYYETTYPDPNITQHFHAVDQIHITAVNNRQQCVSITVSLKNNVHSTSVGGSLLVGKYLQSGISVRQKDDSTRISVPNCANNRLIMNVISQNLDTTIPFLDFKVVRGLNLRESSHGLIGQFWNVRTSVTKYTKPLRDSIVYDNTYLIEIMPRNKPKRSFIGFLYELTWNFGKFPCLYAGNAEGGPIYEATDGEPNDSLIEGTMDDYSTSNFAYDHFDEEKCKIDNVLK